MVNRLLYAALVMIGRDGSAQPGLAAEWKASPDGRYWRFKLRPGLTFEDGSPLDAEAVTRVLDHGRQSGSIPGLRDVTSVRAETSVDLTIELRVHSSLMLEALANQWIIGGESGEASAGPYRVISRQPGRVVLEAFGSYYLGRPEWTGSS